MTTAAPVSTKAAHGLSICPPFILRANFWPFERLLYCRKVRSYLGVGGPRRYACRKCEERRNSFEVFAIPRCAAPDDKAAEHDANVSSAAGIRHRRRRVSISENVTAINWADAPTWGGVRHELRRVCESRRIANRRAIFCVAESSSKQSLGSLSRAPGSKCCSLLVTACSFLHGS